MLIRLKHQAVTLEIAPDLGCFFSQPGGSWVVCHGFIANVQEIISLLSSDAIHSKAQAIAYLVEKNAPLGAAQQIAGSISWFFWDQAQACLWIATDRMGLSPIYYAQTSTGWIFSDSIQSILDECNQTELNQNALIAGALGKLPLVGETFYKAVKQIAFGHLVCLQTDFWQEQVYWQVEPQPILRLAGAEEYDQAYRELLFKVVGQYAPEKNIGITLSSGLDSSSLIAAMRSNRSDCRLIPLSFIAPELPQADEEKYIQKTCQMLNLEPVLIRADHLWTFKNPEVYTPLPTWPFFNYFEEIWQAIFETAQDYQIKVLFGGSGGDYLFGGPTPAYADLLLSLRWMELIDQVRQHHSRSDISLSWKNILKHYIRQPILHTYQPNWLNSPTLVPSYLLTAHRSTAVEILNLPKTGQRQGQPVLPGQQFRLDLLVSPSEVRQLSYRTNIKDIFKIEMRYPFWDHRLIEFALSLPAEQVFHAGYAKWIVRRSLRGRLPDEVLDLPRKIIPPTIAERGLRERSVAAVQTLLTNMRLAEMGIVDEELLRQTYLDYLAGKTNNYVFFFPAVLESWLRRWF